LAQVLLSSSQGTRAKPPEFMALLQRCLQRVAPTGVTQLFRQPGGIPACFSPLTLRAVSTESPGANLKAETTSAPHFLNDPHDSPHFHRRPRRDDHLDLKVLLTHPVYSQEHLERLKEQTHRPTATVSDKVAFAAIQSVRFGFDLVSGYFWKARLNRMSEEDYLRRIIFLETLAGVPGMVAGMVRHLHSLRLMRRDYGWIHSLLAEAENERMHLLISLRLRQPGVIFRSVVIIGQGIFLSAYALSYLLVPAACHRFVGYLEEEAVKTYSHLLGDIDAGNLPMFAQMSAPEFARTYYHLPQNAMLRDVFECIRADECHHRDSNHHFGDLRPDEPNKQVEHLRMHKD